ncbi:hypothetical protein CEE45_00960 [Candidatus Heimdallarchaeota archaeon B3_Heim]|nr:MAG: hypothetical protein CEE45_00960 [Candidatus Heimdallarchaeota archaeon B3_Heim]
MALDDGLFILVDWNFLLLIMGGCVAASWLLIRLSSVSDSEEIVSLAEKVAILGFPVGVISLLMIGAAFYLDSQPIGLPASFDLITLICFGVLGLVLILRPIKNFRFGTFLSLGLGLFGAAILVFLGANQVKIMAGVFIIIFLVIYGSIKMVEDLYLLIAEILSNPMISVTVGVICIIQGLLQLLSFSLANFLFFI